MRLKKALLTADILLSEEKLFPYPIRGLLAHLKSPLHENSTTSMVIHYFFL